MRKAIKGLLVVLMAAAGLTAVNATTAQAGGTYAGCPYGAVCVYPNASWNNGHPSIVLWSYGGHNLSNQFGMHRVFNNQTGTAHGWLCKQYNGANCTPFPNGYPIEHYTFVDYDLGPINSILLTSN